MTIALVILSISALVFAVAILPIMMMGSLESRAEEERGEDE